jgi:hypothetical protein
MFWIPLVVALVLGSINLVASVVVLQSVAYTKSQRGLQLIFIWFVPLAGAAVCLIFDRINCRPANHADIASSDISGLPGAVGHGLGHIGAGGHGMDGSGGHIGH